MEAQGESAGLTQLMEDSILFDFYGGLLTEKQQEIFRLYHEDNLSLSEISQELGISRQGVHDAVKKAVRALHGYEKKLALAQKFQSYTPILERLKEDVQSLQHKIDQDAGKEVLLSDLKRINHWIEQLFEETSN